MNSLKGIDYHHTNEFVRQLVENLSNLKYRKCARAWFDLLIKPRTKNCFPDDIQKTVQLCFIAVTIVDMLVGPFKINPNTFPDPLLYVAANYSHHEFSKMVQDTSVKLFRKENPNMENDEYVAVLQYINNFGLHYTTTTKEIFEHNLENNDLGACAFQILRGSKPKTTYQTI